MLDMTICWDENGKAYTGPPLHFTDGWIRLFDESLLQLVYARNKQRRIKGATAEQAIQALIGELGGV
jgi:hypothetical protein